MPVKVSKRPTIDELLASLDETSSSESNPLINSYRNDFYQFIDTYQIKPGKDKVLPSTLYSLYTHWSQEPLTSYEFGRELAEIIDIRKSRAQINKSVLAIKIEVLKLLKPLDKTHYKGWKQHFDKYLDRYCIKSGGLYLKITVLYNLYDKWCYKNKNRHPLGINQFCSFCKGYFKYKRIDKQYWFAVDHSIEQFLTKEMIDNMKERENVKKENKKK